MGSARFDRPITFEPSAAEFDARQKFVSSKFAALTDKLDFRLLEVHAYLCNAIRCSAVEGGVALYLDTDHLSWHGIELVQPAFDDLFRCEPESSSEDFVNQ